jgi:hypothetical protein
MPADQPSQERGKLGQDIANDTTRGWRVCRPE